MVWGMKNEAMAKTAEMTGAAAQLAGYGASELLDGRFAGHVHVAESDGRRVADVVVYESGRWSIDGYCGRAEYLVRQQMAPGLVALHRQR